MPRRILTTFIWMAALALSAVFVTGGAAAQAETPAGSPYPYLEWKIAADAPFNYSRFDAEYAPSTGLIYILGGRLPDGNTDGSVWSFDPLTGTYTDTGVDLDTPISNYQIALVDDGGADVLMVFGGRPGAGGTTNAVQGYYPATNTPVTFAADPYPVSTAPGGVAVVNNIVYAFGGFNGVSVIADTYIFDITATAGSRWTTGPNLNDPRSYIINAVVDGVIYAFGGDDFDGTALIPLTIAEKLDTNAALVWDDAGVADLPIACDEAPAVGFDAASGYDLAGYIITGGCGQWPDETVEALLYDVGGNTWDIAFPDINESRRNHAGAFYPGGPGGYGTPGFWIWGGIQEADSNLLATPEFYDVNVLSNFDLTPPAQTVVGRLTVDIPLNAHNNSGAADTFNLVYGDTAGWTLTGPASVAVGDGGFAPIGLQVEIPNGAACGATSDITVTATGQGNPALTDVALVEAQADCIGSIAGTVTDANTSLPIENATVTLVDPADSSFGLEVFTDANGDYFMTDLEAGNYEIAAGANGYEGTYDSFQPVAVAVGVTVFDFALNAPIMSWSDNSFNMSLTSNEVATFTLTISNTGTSDLNFSVGHYSDSTLPPPPPQLPEVFGSQKVDPALLAELATAVDGQTDIIVYMGAQADLSGGYLINDWEARGQYVYQQLKVTADRSQAALRAELEAQGKPYRSFFASNSLIVRGDLDLVNRLAARTDVARLLPNGEIPLETNPSSLLRQIASTIQSVLAPDTVEWGVARVNADDVWTDFGTQGQGVVVANIDTGVDWQHTALVNQYRGGAGDHDYNWFLPTIGCDDSNGPCDNDGHGTHTMGTMVGDDGGTNQIGVAPGAEWIACKGCEFNSCSFEALLACGDWMVAPTDSNNLNPDPSERPHIVNNSWGGGGGDFWYGGVVSAWRAAGIFPQFSGGNSGPGCVTSGSPGDYWMSQAAGATALGDAIAGFSSRGPSNNWNVLKPDISAPGVNVRSSIPGGGYANFNGTSMASPHVAGVTALLWAASPNLVGQIEDSMWLLQQTADPQFTNDGCGGDTNTSHPNHTFGWGIVDAHAAVSLALSGEITLPWLEVTPMGGVIPPGGALDVNLVVTAPGAGGTYTGTLQLTADEPYTNDVRIPLTLEVEGISFNYMPAIFKP